MFQNLFIFDLFSRGGPVMIPIALCSVFALAIAIERFRFFRRIQQRPEQFMKQVKAAINQGNFHESMRLCKEENHPIARVIAAGIDHLDFSRDALLDVMRQEAIRWMKQVNRNIDKLATIASISPLLGLTGTVTGMISSFQIITSGGMGDPTLLAGGISEALYTTAAGLLVGIPALVAYNWCEARSNDFADMVEYYSLDLVNHVAGMEVRYEKVAA